MLNAVRTWLYILPSAREGFRRRDLRHTEIGFDLHVGGAGSGNELLALIWVRSPVSPLVVVGGYCSRVITTTLINQASMKTIDWPSQSNINKTRQVVNAETSTLADERAQEASRILLIRVQDYSLLQVAWMMILPFCRSYWASSFTNFYCFPLFQHEMPATFLGCYEYKEKNKGTLWCACCQTSCSQLNQ
jgi:hypothetical protein